MDFPDLIKNQNKIIRHIRELEKSIQDLSKSLERNQTCLGIGEISSNIS